jgi:hypothetical protein
MKTLVGLLLFIGPWLIFFLAAHFSGATNTFVLFLTLVVSALGFMLLIGRGGKDS